MGKDEQALGVKDLPTNDRTRGIVVALTYAAGAIACLLLLGFATIKPFSLLSATGDSFYALNFAKNYVEGAGFRINPFLAYPTVQDNAYYPSFEFSIRAFMRLSALFSDSAASVYYMMYVAGVVAMFAAAAYSLRTLKFSHALSIFGAIVYVVSPWLTFRAFAHDFLALSFAVPLGAALALRVGLDPDTPVWRQPGAIISVLIFATSGIYFGFFSLMFIAFLGTVAALTRRTPMPIASIVAVAAASLILLMVTGYGSALPEILTGSIPQVKRLAGSQLVFGLNFSEATFLFDSVPHMGWVKQEYIAFWPYLRDPHYMLDWPGLALTLVIFTSPLLLAILSNLSGQRSYEGSLILLSTASIVFGIIYAMPGGLGYYFGLFVNGSIRATDRILPFLAFFALVVVLATVKILLLARKPISTFVAGAALSALALAMLPSINGLADHYRSVMDAPRTVHNLESIHGVLAAKDKEDLKAILQLPHAAWPETAPERQYDMLSLQSYFIFDHKGSKTRWSYGSRWDQPSYQAIEKIIHDNHRTDLASAAKTMGFDGAVLDKIPLGEEEWRTLAANLSENSCKIYEDDLRLVFAFHKCT
jgi:hypothetical protein